MILELNNQVKARVSRDALHQAVQAFAKVTAQPVNKRVSVALIDDAHMRRYNRIYSGLNSTTDVLSFAADEGLQSGFQVLPEQQNFIGEMLIAYPQAKRQAKEHGLTIKQEIVRLLIHGLLHLIGYDHQNSAQAKRMEHRAAAILELMDR